MKQYVFNDFIEEFLGKTVLIKKKNVKAYKCLEQILFLRHSEVF